MNIEATWIQLEQNRALRLFVHSYFQVIQLLFEPLHCLNFLFSKGPPLVYQ